MLEDHIKRISKVNQEPDHIKSLRNRNLKVSRYRRAIAKIDTKQDYAYPEEELKRST